MFLDVLLYLAAAAASGLVLGFLIGRHTAQDTGRIQDLETRVEGLEKEREQALAELAAAREAIRLKQEEFDAYRGRVNDHFSGTSELLRDLTHRYRSVYAHLTAGASELCPEGFVGLEEGLEPGVLSSGEGATEAERNTSPESPDGSAAQGDEEPKETV